MEEKCITKESKITVLKYGQTGILDVLEQHNILRKVKKFCCKEEDQSNQTNDTD